MRTKKKEKRRRLTGEKTIRCCGQGENMEKYGFGVDVGGTSCKLGLFTDSGKLMEKWEIPTDTSEQGEHIIEHRQRERGLADEQIIGVGIDTPGIAGRDGVVRGAVNLGWEACPVQEQLKMRLQKKVCVCNDANAAALGELWQGGGRGYRDMVMVTLGTGVGGAVILNGKVLAGAHGIAGEIGHMTVFHKEIERCACGKYGCVEQYASAKGLIRITRQLLDAAKRGDRLALDAVEVLGKALGSALAAVAEVIDPEVFVIGGGIAGAGEIIPRIVQKYYRPDVLPAGADIPFELARLGNDAGMYGSMKLLLDSSEEK